MNKKFGLFAFLWIFVSCVALMAQTGTNVRYIYDEADQLVGVIDENGNVTTYKYDEAGNLVAVERLTPRGAVDIFLVEPNSGTIGTTVTIHGVGFSAVPAENQVTFNGARAAVLSSTATTITTRVPVGASTGPVRVTAPAGTGTSRSNFTLVRSPESDCVNTTSGLVSWWPAEGDARDIIGNNHGALRGGVTFAPGRVGQAFSLNGAGQFVDLPAINMASRTFAIDFWMFPTRSASQQNLVSNARTTGNFGELWLNGDHLEYQQGTSGGVNTPAGSIRLNAWSHVALTYDGLVVRIYINGAVAATSGVHDEIFNNALRLGNSFLQDGNFFGGLLDEVELYNRALSASEVQAIFTAGSNGKCKQLHIITTQLPDNAVGQPASHQIETRFGAPPLTFDLASGSLPTGMALSPSGVVSGTPTATGTFTFTVVVTDMAGATVNGTITKKVGVCIPPPSGLVSWWPGDGNARDIISNRHGTLVNGATFAAGQVGPAFSLNGTNQFVDLPAINLASRTFAIDFWMFPTRSASQQNLVSNRRATGNFGELWLNGDHLEYRQGSGGGVSTGAGSIRLNAWSHVALTYDGLVVRIYINGAVAATSGVHDEIFNNALRLGNSFLQDANFFGGLLDEVTLYNRALSADEIQAIFAVDNIGKCKPLYVITTQLPDNIVDQPASHQIETRFGIPPLVFELVSGTLPPGITLDKDGVLSGTPTAAGTFSFTVQVTDDAGATATGTIRKRVVACVPRVSGLVSWWPGEGNANDIIGPNNGTLQGGTTFVPGKVGQAFSFNGAAAYVEVPHNASLDFAFPRDFTLEAWVNFGINVDLFDLRTIVSKRSPDNANVTYQFHTEFNTGRLRLSTRSGGGGFTGVSSASFSWLPNTWYHVAVTVTGNDVTFYRDGQAVGTGTLPIARPSTTGKFTIGAALADAPLGVHNPWKGLIDEVSVYNRALSASEIQGIFAAGSAGKCRP